MRTITSHVSGFTFVETLMVIGLLGLVATVALPNFLSAQPSDKKAGISSTRRTEKAKTATAPLKGRTTSLALHNAPRQELGRPGDTISIYEAGLTNSTWSLASFNGSSL